MRILGKTGNIVFQAGKVKLYSDFDSTYCPIKQSSLDQKPTSKPYMENYCSRMKDLFEKTKSDMDFHITTGRTFAEYKVFSELLQKHGIALPYPKTLITKNGADEFFPKNIQNNEFPFVLDKFNRYKKDTVKKAFSESNLEIKNDLKACGLLQKIQDLPLYAVVVKKGDSPLTILSDVFRDSGKVIEVESGTLDDAVKKIIYDHAQKDKSFKKLMSSEFKNFIFGKRVGKAIIIAISIISSLSVLALAFLKKRQNENTAQSYK